MRLLAREELQSALQQPLTWWLARAGEGVTDLLIVAAGVLSAAKLTNVEPSALTSLALGSTCLIALLIFGRYRTASRYFGLSDFLALVPIALTIGCGAALIQYATDAVQLVYPILVSFFSLSGLASIRIAKRLLADSRSPHSKEHSPVRVLVVGAGDAGETIIRELLRRKRTYQVVGLIDDDPQKSLLSIHGIRVIGTTKQIAEIAELHRVKEVLIAAPSATGEQMRSILACCESAQLRVRTLPGVNSMLGSSEMLPTLREVDIDDLLRRDPSDFQSDLPRKLVEGVCVLITGAGGSIGSELARQISELNPSNLILVGKGENSIFEIDEEIKWDGAVPPISIIADVRDKLAMEQIFERHRPAVVFHAAAHKHVPLMQSNYREAISNNVLGTRVVVECAAKYGAKKFICVSTDKAVKPTSIMGATKRVAEMVVAAVAQQSETEMAIVRFGNVLGSRGSLIPILKRQIARGGPIRLTHPEMSRYFMTIPEAVHLVMQAAAMGRRGELFLLDMGDPIRIIDIARDLIRLHGLLPDQDIKIEFTGIRPGEKLHEELLYDQEHLIATPHHKIKKVAAAVNIESDWILNQVRRLDALCEAGESEIARELLMELAWTPLSELYRHDLPLAS